jgi:hypothetical protein
MLAHSAKHVASLLKRMKQMNNEQPWNYSFNINQSWPKNDWVGEWLNTSDLTELMMMYQDLLETEVEKSTAEAVDMLTNIGIRC